MDALIGKPFYSNAAGAVIDPNTGLEAVSTEPTFRPEQLPDTTEVFKDTPIPAPTPVAVEPNDDLEAIRIETERKKAEALRLANLTEAEKAERERRIQLMVAQREARKIAKQQPIIVPVPYIAPPLVIGGGGGGGSMEEPSTPKASSKIAPKPSFLKKNFIPILLVASAIYIFIKKPIK
jgi:hypothetical protein